MTLHISNHALLRYQERVANVPLEQARKALSTKAIKAAVEFGAKFVRLGTGQRVCIEDHTIVTVLPADHHKRQVHRRGLGRYGCGNPRKEN